MKRFKYQCIEQEEITNDISILRFAPHSDAIPYISGQYVNAYFNDEMISLSIATRPNQNGILEFHLRHNAAQPLAAKFKAFLGQNQHVIFSGPYGHTTLQRIHHGPVIFLAGGTGFAPMNALIHDLLKQDYSERIRLYWGVRKPQDAYALAQLEQWRLQHPQFNFTIVLSEPEQFIDWQGPTGLVHDHMASQHPSLEGFQVFSSGPMPMLTLALQKLVLQGLDPEHFFTDVTMQPERV